MPPTLPTDAREQPPAPAPPDPPSLLEQLLEVERVNRRTLASIDSALRGQAATIAVSEKAQQPHLETDFPFPGSSRWLIPRTAVGGLFTVKVAASLLLAENSNRLGGYIVNGGNKTVTLILADAESSGRGGVSKIILAAGERWDLRLGNLLWCGSISAQAAEGEQSVSVVEV